MNKTHSDVKNNIFEASTFPISNELLASFKTINSPFFLSTGKKGIYCGMLAVRCPVVVFVARYRYLVKIRKVPHPWVRLILYGLSYNI